MRTIKLQTTSLLLIIALVFTFTLAFPQDSYGASAKYTSSVVKVGKVSLTKITVGGSKLAWAESGSNKYGNAKSATKAKLANSTVPAKLLFYYSVVRDYGNTNATSLKIQNALTYLKSGKGAIKADALSSAKTMVANAKKINIPSYYNFKAYRYTTKVKVNGKKLTFLSYTVNPTKYEVGINWPSNLCKEAVDFYGGKGTILPVVTTVDAATTQLKKVSALILPGGESVYPELYGDPITYSFEYNLARDASDLCYLTAARKMDMPVLAICRGIEVLNVWNGGTIFQDVQLEAGASENHYKNHKINVLKNSLLADVMGSGSHKICSSHHQSVAKIGRDVKVNARSPEGIVEAINIKNMTFCLGIQFHPEKKSFIDSVESSDIFTRLIDEAKQYSKKK